MNLSRLSYSGHNWIILGSELPPELIRPKDENLKYLILGHDPTNSVAIRELVEKSGTLRKVDSIGGYVTRVSLPKDLPLNGLAAKITALGGTIQEDTESTL